MAREASKLFEGNSECGENEDTLDKRCKNNGDHEDRGGCAWVAASGFSGFRTEDANAETTSESCCCYCECFSEHDVWLVVGYYGFLHPPQSLPWSECGKGSVMFFVAVITDQFEENGTEESEDERLDETDQKLHKVEWQCWEKREILGHQCHELFERLLTTVDVTEQTEAERDGPDRNRDHLKDTDEEENRNHHDHHQSFELTLRGEDVSEESFDAILGNGPVEPEDGKCEGHRSRHVDVGVAAAHPWNESSVAVTVIIFPTNRSNTWNKRHVVGDKDEEKDRTEEPKDTLHEVGAKETFEEFVEGFDQPLCKVLQAGRHQRHLASGNLAEENNNTH